MNIHASISISRIHSNHEPDCIHIRVEDETSGCMILDLEMSLAAFAQALTGLSGMKCEGVLYKDAPVGKQRQVKEELVSRPKKVTLENQEAVAAKAFAPFEVDGWQGRVSDLFNHHRRVEINTANEEIYRVVFTRFVDAVEEE